MKNFTNKFNILMAVALVLPSMACALNSTSRIENAAVRMANGLTDKFVAKIAQITVKLTDKFVPADESINSDELAKDLATLAIGVAGEGAKVVAGSTAEALQSSLSTSENPSFQNMASSVHPEAVTKIAEQAVDTVNDRTAKSIASAVNNAYNAELPWYRRGILRYTAGAAILGLGIYNRKNIDFKSVDLKSTGFIAGAISAMGLLAFWDKK